MSDPAFACTEVELVATIVQAVHSVTVWTDKVQLRIQLTHTNPCFPLVMREFLQLGATFVLTWLGDHVVGRSEAATGDSSPRAVDCHTVSQIV